VPELKGDSAPQRFFPPPLKIPAARHVCTMKEWTIPAYKEVTNSRDMIENETIRVRAAKSHPMAAAPGNRRMRLE
jgi:hypothetical protein